MQFFGRDSYLDYTKISSIYTKSQYQAQYRPELPSYGQLLLNAQSRRLLHSSGNLGESFGSENDIQNETKSDVKSDVKNDVKKNPEVYNTSPILPVTTTTTTTTTSNTTASLFSSLFYGGSTPTAKAASLSSSSLERKNSRGIDGKSKNTKNAQNNDGNNERNNERNNKNEIKSDNFIQKDNVLNNNQIKSNPVDIHSIQRYNEQYLPDRPPSYLEVSVKKTNKKNKQNQSENENVGEKNDLQKIDASATTTARKSSIPGNTTTNTNIKPPYPSPLHRTVSQPKSTHTNPLYNNTPQSIHPTPPPSILISTQRQGSNVGKSDPGGQRRGENGGDRDNSDSDWDDNGDDWVVVTDGLPNYNKISLEQEYEEELQRNQQLKLLQIAQQSKKNNSQQKQ